MKITIPRIAKKYAYCHEVRGTFFAQYWADGKIKRHSLRTGDLDKAAVARDAFFAELLKQGATYRKSVTKAQKVAADNSRYIYERQPFMIRIDSVTIGYADTRKAAEKIRDKHLASI